MADAQMLSKVDGVNKNLAAIVKAIAGAFVGNGSFGSLSLAAAASLTVSDTNVQSGSVIICFPANAAAGTLQGSSKSLYVSAKVPGASFTVATASGGNAAGTEIFNYIICNLPA